MTAAAVRGRERARGLATGLMALALAASPAYVVRPHLGPLPTTVLELVLVCAIAAGLYAFWPHLPWRSPYLWPASLLLLAATVDTLLAPDRRAAAGLWKAYFVEPMFAGLVVAAIARSRDRARLLLAGLAIAGAVAALVNAVVVVHALVVHTFNPVTPPVAIYNTANAVPLYLEPLFAVALALALYSDDRRERAAGAAFAPVAALAIALSFSRGGWLTLGVLTVFISLFGRLRWLVAAGCALAGGLLFAGSQRVRDRILVELNPSSVDNTLLLRLSLWRSTLNMLAHRPLFGGGLGGFKASLLPYRDPGYHEDLIYPHNLLLNFWSETGLLGLAAFLWLAAQVFRVARQGLAAGPWVRSLSIGLLGMLVAFLVHGLVDAPYFKNDQALAFWALLGLQLGAFSSARPR
jgi:O-antigen ligase